MLIDILDVHGRTENGSPKEGLCVRPMDDHRISKNYIPENRHSGRPLDVQQMNVPKTDIADVRQYLGNGGPSGGYCGRPLDIHKWLF